MAIFLAVNRSKLMGVRSPKMESAVVDGRFLIELDSKGVRIMTTCYQSHCRSNAVVSERGKNEANNWWLSMWTGNVAESYHQLGETDTLEGICSVACAEKISSMVVGVSVNDG